MSGLRLAVVATACVVLLSPPLAAAADVGQGETIVMDPAQGRVGTRFVVVCKDFPEPANFDSVFIVAAGTPDVDPNSPAGQGVKVLWQGLVAECFRNQGHFFSKAGPFAPGNYEARFATELYNNDHRKEIATRTPFTVR